jgi:hypothetical protein
MNWKFSLKWLLAGVTIVAIGAAALVNATQAWSQVMFGVTLVLLLSSILAAMYTGRGFYTGFSLFASAYWLLVVPPAWGDHFAERVPTWPVSDYVYKLVSHERQPTQRELAREFPFRTRNPGQSITVTRPLRMYFDSIAQFCWVIFVGVLGGVIGVYIKAASERAKVGPGEGA